MKVSVIGATGYAGAELLRLLWGHQEAEVVYLTSESSTGKELSSIYPHLKQFYDQKLASLNQLDEIVAASDVLFIALPHGHAMAVGQKVQSSGVKIIDLGADYRLYDTKVYEQWYKVPHTHPNAGAVYGLTELYRDQVKTAQIVGNPGCYTTASILALAPLVKNHLVELNSVIVDAKSGVTGSGRGLNLGSLFCEAGESLKAYNVGGHRHTPEIEQALTELSGDDWTINFTPHLIPMDRGILSTCYATLKAGVTAQQVTEAFEELYSKEHFIRLRGLGGYPATKWTRGTNFCDLGWHVDPRTGRVIVISAIDNLVKGAAGQAVQNLNVLFGLPETTGLDLVPFYP